MLSTHLYLQSINALVMNVYGYGRIYCITRGYGAEFFKVSTSHSTQQDGTKIEKTVQVMYALE